MKCYRFENMCIYANKTLCEVCTHTHTPTHQRTQSVSSSSLMAEFFPTWHCTALICFLQVFDSYLMILYGINKVSYDVAWKLFYSLCVSCASSCLRLSTRFLHRSAHLSALCIFLHPLLAHLLLPSFSQFLAVLLGLCMCAGCVFNTDVRPCRRP